MSLLDQINCNADLQKLKIEELSALAQEIRARIIEVTKANGGHLASNLGIVETTIALHRCFDFSKDKIVFDVGTRKFSHTRPDGTAWRTVSSAAYGENIAMGQRTADKVMAAWMTSSGHRANILRASYGSIGVCAVVSGGVTYWVQLFGK